MSLVDGGMPGPNLPHVDVPVYLVLAVIKPRSDEARAASPANQDEAPQFGDSVDEGSSLATTILFLPVRLAS